MPSGPGELPRIAVLDGIAYSDFDHCDGPNLAYMQTILAHICISFAGGQVHYEVRNFNESNKHVLDLRTYRSLLAIASIHLHISTCETFRPSSMIADYSEEAIDVVIAAVIDGSRPIDYRCDLVFEVYAARLLQHVFFHFIQTSYFCLLPPSFCL